LPTGSAWKRWRAAGDQLDFAIDCGAALTAGDAASLSDALERLHPLWLDEPCELTNLAAIRKIAAERATRWDSAGP